MRRTKNRKGAGRKGLKSAERQLHTVILLKGWDCKFPRFSATFSLSVSPHLLEEKHLNENV